MADRTDAELERIADLALERLDARAARVAAEPGPAPQPMRATYDVRSAQTGAVVIVDVPREVAEREAQRLNGAARQVIGTVPEYVEQNGVAVRQADAGRPVYAGGQRGQATEYVVTPREALDELAAAEQLREQAALQAGPTDDAQAEQLDELERQADELERRGREAAAAREAAERG